MYAMILAAGKGERMRPLSQDTPKPLLQAGGKPLLQYHIEALAAAAITRIVINTGRLGKKIETCFGSGDRFGVELCYSHEGDEPLGTGGGIQRALPWLGQLPFILVNGDVWTDFDYARLPARIPSMAHLIMVNNPGHNPDGDFALFEGKIDLQKGFLLTYSGIGLYKPELFVAAEGQLFSLVPLLKQAIHQGKVSGQHYNGQWFDMGTPERLDELNQLLNN